MKKMSFLALTAALFLTAAAVAQAQSTPGLAFTLINNGTAYEVGKGTATAAQVIIPAAYEGKPVTANKGLQRTGNKGVKSREKKGKQDDEILPSCFFLSSFFFFLLNKGFFMKKPAIFRVKEKTMANKRFWTGILAITLVFAMAAVGCDDGTTYILTITKNASRDAYEAAVGDYYVLVIRTNGQPDKVSEGTVSDITSVTYTLKPTAANADAPTFSVTITASGGQITRIEGTITFKDGSTVTGSGMIIPQGNGGGADTWSNVTSFSQLNGTWKPQSATMTFTYKESLGDAWNDTLESMLGDMRVTYSYNNYTATYNSTAKTAAKSGSYTIAYSGTGEYLGLLWASAVSSAEFNANAAGTTVSSDEADHSVTTAFNNVPITIPDDSMPLFLSSLLINQTGTKIKDVIGNGVAEVFIKQ